MANCEKEIIGRLIARDPKTVNELVVSYQAKVYRTCLAYVHHEADAADITQEVFIKVFEKLEQFKGDSTLSTWIIRIAINLSLNYLRDNKKHKSVIGVERSDELKMEPSSNRADKPMEEELVIQALKEAVDSLPENQSKVFVLQKYHDYSHKQISEVTGLTVSAVESLLVRARKNLQKKLSHFYNENFK